MDAEHLAAALSIEGRNPEARAREVLSTLKKHHLIECVGDKPAKGALEASQRNSISQQKRHYLYMKKCRLIRRIRLISRYLIQWTERTQKPARNDTGGMVMGPF